MAPVSAIPMAQVQTGNQSDLNNYRQQPMYEQQQPMYEPHQPPQYAQAAPEFQVQVLSQPQML